MLFIGEIRSGEVGKMLCQAALTGHLVFSALHTSDAPGVPARMIEMMHIEPSLVASSLRAVLAQRLIRLVCPQCKAEHPPDPKALNALGLEGEDRARTFYLGQGCPACNMTGYRGRTGVYQLLDFTGEVREAVMSGRAGDIARAGRAAGMRTLREAALDKLFRGETTVEEVIRRACPQPASA